MITCGQLAPSLAGTVGRRLRNGITMAGSFGENGRRCAGVAGPGARRRVGRGWRSGGPSRVPGPAGAAPVAQRPDRPSGNRDRKSTRLNSRHVANSYAVFCLKKKNKNVKEVEDGRNA